jgi:hypothetical protein
MPDPAQAQAEAEKNGAQAPNALEQAVKLADLTSPDEDALRTARMLHFLATKVKNIRREMLGDLIDEGDPYFENVLLPDGTVEQRYRKADDGEAKTLEGDACQSYRQRLDDLAQGIANVEKASRSEQIIAQVNKELAEIQKQEYDASKQAAEKAARGEQ